MSSGASFWFVCISSSQIWRGNRLKERPLCDDESVFAGLGGTTIGSHALSLCCNFWRVKGGLFKSARAAFNNLSSPSIHLLRTSLLASMNRRLDLLNLYH